MLLGSTCVDNDQEKQHHLLFFAKNLFTKLTKLTRTCTLCNNCHHE